MAIIKKEIIGSDIKCLIGSTNIIESNYNTSTLDLLITFNSGRVYKYKNIVPEVYNKFETAESHGKFFHGFLKTLPAVRMGDVDPTPLITEIKSKL
jgi:hypothetical protein